MAGRLLYIPTNRKCSLAISEYAKEADFISQKTGDKTYFVVVESTNDEVAISNAATIERIRKNAVDIIHFTVDKQVAFIEQVLNNAQRITPSDKGRLLKLLLPTDVSYGSGPNKTALLAAALGASVIHRRDSDTRPCKIKKTPLYPSEIECKVVGKKYGKYKAFFAGSGYFGDRPLNYGELIAASSEFVYRLKQIENPARDYQEIIKRVDGYLKVQPEPKRYRQDIVRLDSDGMAEMGNCAIGELFKILPELPMHNTLGSDYMEKNLLYRLHYPVIYHSRNVVHDHFGKSGNRQGNKEFVAYNLRDVRFKLLVYIRNTFGESLKKNREGMIASEKIVDTKVYATMLRRVLRVIDKKELLNIIDQLANLYDDVYRYGKSKKYKKYSILASTIRKNSDILVSETLQGFDDYCFLVSKWKYLIQSAEKVGFNRKIQQPVEPLLYDWHNDLALESQKHDIAFLKKIIKQYSAHNILIVGAGTGRVAIPLSQTVTVTALDKDQDRLARLKSRKSNIKEIICSDILGFDPQGQKYDLVISPYSTIQAFYPPTTIKKAFERISSALKDDGLFVFDVSTSFNNKPSSSWQKILSGYCSELGSQVNECQKIERQAHYLRISKRFKYSGGQLNLTERWSYYNEELIKQSLAATSFKVIKVYKGYGKNISTHRRIYVCKKSLK